MSAQKRQISINIKKFKISIIIKITSTTFEN